MEGSNSRRIRYAKPVYLQVQIESTAVRFCLFLQEETPDGQRRARKTRSLTGETPSNSAGSWLVAVRVTPQVGFGRSDGLSAHLGIRARDNRTSVISSSSICASGRRSHGRHCR